MVTSPTRTREHEDDYGKPPAGRRFQKGQSGNPCGSRGKNLPALLVATLNAPAITDINGVKKPTIREREINKPPAEIREYKPE